MRTTILEETLARLEAERYAPPVTAPTLTRAATAPPPPMHPDRAAANRVELATALGLDATYADLATIRGAA